MELMLRLCKNMNKEIINIINTMFKEEGLHETFLKDVKICKSVSYSPREPLIYDFCLIIVLEGKKTGYLPNRNISYSSDNYIVVPTILPFECETYASKEDPFSCILVSIDNQVMYELIDTISKDEPIDIKKDNLSVFEDKVSPQIEDVIFRLVNILKSKEDSEILGNQILRELFYRIAMGKNASFLHKMFLNTTNEAKIARVLKYIHQNYMRNLDIPTLARKEDMSASSFNAHFKRITMHTPLQYIKKIRLNKARDFISKYNYQVNETAQMVGYESIPQFSNDYKSYFGHAPKYAKPYCSGSK